VSFYFGVCVRVFFFFPFFFLLLFLCEFQGVFDCESCRGKRGSSITRAVFFSTSDGL